MKKNVTKRTVGKFNKQEFTLFFIVVFAMACLLDSCNHKPASNKITTEAELIDQPYGDHDKQKFDIYLPAGRSSKSTPTLFLIHGGGWAAGDKSFYKPEIKRLQAIFPQMAFVAVGYRLADGKALTNQFPTQELDVKACIAYIMDNREKYGISKRFALYGGSAGAHLAMLFAYKHGHTTYKPAAVVSLVGPGNISTLYNQVMLTDDPNKSVYFGWFVDAVGGTNEQKPEMCYASSPINFITAKSPPTLLLYGEDDTIVPRQQADELDAKLTAAGVKHIYKLYPGQGHNVQDVIPEINRELTDFLKIYLK